MPRIQLRIRHVMGLVALTALAAGVTRAVGLETVLGFAALPFFMAMPLAVLGALGLLVDVMLAVSDGWDGGRPKAVRDSDSASGRPRRFG